MTTDKFYLTYHLIPSLFISTGWFLYLSQSSKSDVLDWELVRLTYKEVCCNLLTLQQLDSLSLASKFMVLWEDRSFPFLWVSLHDFPVPVSVADSSSWPLQCGQLLHPYTHFKCFMILVALQKNMTIKEMPTSWSALFAIIPQAPNPYPLGFSLSTLLLQNNWQILPVFSAKPFCFSS